MTNSAEMINRSTMCYLHLWQVVTTLQLWIIRLVSSVVVTVWIMIYVDWNQHAFYNQVIIISPSINSSTRRMVYFRKKKSSQLITNTFPLSLLPRRQSRGNDRLRNLKAAQHNQFHPRRFHHAGQRQITGHFQSP